jgi:hypothetical protein
MDQIDTTAEAGSKPIIITAAAVAVIALVGAGLVALFSMLPPP